MIRYSFSFLALEHPDAGTVCLHFSNILTFEPLRHTQPGRLRRSERNSRRSAEHQAAFRVFEGGSKVRVLYPSRVADPVAL